MKYTDLALKEKIAQMFIVGYNGLNYLSDKYFCDLLDSALGGVIFFTQNISGENQIRETILSIGKKAKIPPFFSIDQEGGRVERTEKIHGGKKYLSAKKAYLMGLSYLQNQTKEIALELKGYGFNMNFAPVIDVNTNPDNPIIAERAFSSDTDEVISAMKVVMKEYEKYGIITVAKHFPGHGGSSADSHKTLPVIDIEKNEFFDKHIRPFREAVKNNIPAIMAAHVLYPALGEDRYPASVSQKIINDILIEDIGFDGVIITDDMEMNGIKGFSREEACIRAINAGVSMFIFRSAEKEICELILKIENAVNNGLIDIEKINRANEKIINLKYRYGIIR